MTTKLELTPGKFYKSIDSYIWCCFRVRKWKPKQAQADCIRVLDGRVEYFFIDGRYDEGGRREHSLIEEVSYEYDT